MTAEEKADLERALRAERDEWAARTAKTRISGVYLRQPSFITPAKPLPRWDEFQPLRWTYAGY